VGYSLLVSADFWSTQPDQLAADVVTRLGLPAVQEKWIQDFPGYGYRAIFARVNKSRLLAPTAIEMIGPRPVPPELEGRFPASCNAAYAALQGHRPVKTHSTVVGCDDLAGLADDMRRKGVPFRHVPGTDQLAFDRYWVGVTDDAPFAYTPQHDAGLFLEFVPTAALRLPSAATPPPDSMVVADVRRILHRQWLVNNLERSLETLRENLGWASGPVTDADGYRYADLDVSLARGATIRLMQPAQRGQVDEHLRTWGPGPYFTRVAISDTEAQAEVLERHSAAYRLYRDGSDASTVLQVQPNAIPGALFEFVPDPHEGNRRVSPRPSRSHH
jgi:hypothetical protein